MDWVKEWEPAAKSKKGWYMGKKEELGQSVVNPSSVDVTR